MIVISYMSDILLYDNKQNTSLTNFNIKENFDRRFAKKRDKSVLYALKAMEILESQFKIDSLNLNDTGIFLSNIYGGWDYVEHQLADLYKQGLDVINPYVATAWFATAAQGEISIKYGIKGYSKTLCAGNIGGGIALKHSYEKLLDKKIESAIVGAVEAPNTKLLNRVICNNAFADGSILFLLENEDDAHSLKHDVKIRILDINITKKEDLNLKKIANKKNAVIVDVKINQNKIDIVDNQQDIISDKFLKIELFSLEIPYLIKILYETYKGQGQDVLLNCSDTRQTFSLYMNIL